MKDILIKRNNDFRTSVNNYRRKNDLIEYPERAKYMITNKQIWQILVLVETQGGNKTNASKINQIMEEVTKERDM